LFFEPELDDAAHAQVCDFLPRKFEQPCISALCSRSTSAHADRPELDIVAVTTARDFCPLGKLADDIAGAVKSETALPADSAGANVLATAIRKVSVDEPAEASSTR
jgi:hypothetical protein